MTCELVVFKKPSNAQHSVRVRDERTYFMRVPKLLSLSLPSHVPMQSQNWLL